MKESIYDNMTKCEKEVADVLKEMGIKWRYEQAVFIWSFIPGHFTTRKDMA